MSVHLDWVLLQRLCTLARAAGRAVMEVYQGDPEIHYKTDGTHLTTADLVAQDVIIAGLSALEPAWPIVSEEMPQLPWEIRRVWNRYWLIDPIDGTHEFVKRSGEFTVNIALVDRHQCVLGVVLAPVSEELFAAACGLGAWFQDSANGIGIWERLNTRALCRPSRVLTSRSHSATRQQAVLDRLLTHDYQFQMLGSSLKFCRIAQGMADMYLRLGPTSHWDTAAGQCVLEQAGGVVLDRDGTSLCYNRTSTLLNRAFIAVGDSTIPWSKRLQGIAAECYKHDWE